MKVNKKNISIPIPNIEIEKYKEEIIAATGIPESYISDFDGDTLSEMSTVNIEERLSVREVIDYFNS